MTLRAQGRAAIAAFVLLAAAAARGETLADYARHASCLIGPNNVFKLSMAVQGTLASVLVERSDRVQKDQVIAQLESGVEQAQLDAAKVRAETDVIIRLKQAVHETAAAKLERMKTLRAETAATQQSVDDASSAAAIALSELEQARLDKKLAALEVERLEANLRRRILRAPANGVITAVDLHPGEYADPANSVATLTEIDPLKIAVYLPANAYPLVSVGMHALITPQETSSKVREAVVRVKDPQIDASSGLFLVQLKMGNPGGDIPAGISCRVEFLGEK
ncbi:MAG TPA: efflux RND transporter periplasmic adaptor subunit [Bradyrhizobium sp.]|nr:efflux RND transporter periplasmic adaptor subunit [Bradyrhizobium sp.]